MQSNGTGIGQNAARTSGLSLSLLGIATVILADTPELLAAAHVVYGEGESVAALPRLVIRLTTRGTIAQGVSFAIRVEGSRLWLNGPAIIGEADAGTGRAEATVPPGLAQDAAAFVALMDTLLLFLLTRSGRIPVHAAGIVHGNRALLLAGPSGSGKSTLALAAADAGLAVLSDDTVYIQTEPALHVWGWPRPIHVFPQDAPAGEFPLRERGGKRKAAVPLPAVLHHVDAATLIVLERGTALALEPIDRAEAGTALLRLEPGFDLLADEARAAARVLTAGGSWRLTLARDPRAAVAFLLARLPPA